MRGALLLTAAKTPYRRAGLAFPVGMPLTVPILSLGVGQLRQLLEDPQVTVMAGQDNGAYVVAPELTAAVSDDDLQAFIDAAPAVDVDAIPVAPAGPEVELAAIRQRADETSMALMHANDQIVALQDAAKASAAVLADTQAHNEALAARIAELEAKLEEATKADSANSAGKAKPAGKPKSADS